MYGYDENISFGKVYLTTSGCCIPKANTSIMQTYLHIQYIQLHATLYLYPTDLLSSEPINMQVDLICAQLIASSTYFHFGTFYQEKGTKDKAQQSVYICHLYSEYRIYILYSNKISVLTHPKGIG